MTRRLRVQGSWKLPAKGTPGATTGPSVVGIGVAGGTGIFPFTQTAQFLDPIPANPVLDANSASLGALLSSGTRVALTETFSSPIYTVTSATPVYRASNGTLGVTFPADFGDIDLRYLDVRIPDDAQGAPGTDGWATFINYEMGYLDSLFQLQRIDGIWSCSSGGRFLLNGAPTTPKVAYASFQDQWQKDLIAAGHIRQEDAVEYLWKQPLTQATGSGVSLAAGPVTAYDLEQPSINHALVCAISQNWLAGPSRKGPYRYPATSTDGYQSPYQPASHFAAGMRLQLNPSFNMDTVNASNSTQTAALRKVGKAMQTYGCYVVDRGGSPFSLGCERANTPAKRETYTANGWGIGDGYVDLSPIFAAGVRVLKRWNGAA